MIRKILTVDKDRQLFTVSRDVKSEECLIVATNLLETSKSLKGCIGLAAPQIGYPINMILVNVKGGTVVMVNPKLISTGGKNSLGLEGCFSRPKTIRNQIRVKRWTKVKVQYETIDGKLLTTQYRGMDARVVQHEMDHLEGVIIGMKPVDMDQANLEARTLAYLGA